MSWDISDRQEEILDLLKPRVDMETLVRKVSFTLDDFERANLEQPKFNLEAGRYLTGAVLERARADSRLEVRSAELAQEFRDTAVGKMTEKALEQKLSADPELRKLKRRAYLSKVMEVWAKQLLESYGHRLQVLGNITKIRSGEIASGLRAVKEEAAVKELGRMRKKAEAVRRRIEEQE